VEKFVMDLFQQFQRMFEAKPGLRVVAPGRVNLIGEHTDYNDGFVMPIAIQFAVTILAGPRDDGQIHLVSADFGQKTAFAAGGPVERDPGRRWSDYEKGVVSEYLKLGHVPRGANLLIHGDIPMASGLSSSAAIEVATAVALRSLNGFAIDDLDLVKLCQKAENDFVGMKCGIMDQFVSCLGRAGHALFLDCRSLDYRLTPFPGDRYSVVILNTKMKRELTGSEYNERRSQCEEGVRLLRKALPGIRALRDVSIEDFEKHAGSLPEMVSRRCRHVVSENQRVLDFVEALPRSDEGKIGGLLLDSHESLKNLFEVSCPELDLMVDLAMSVQGVIGARMTGAGFGGCAIAVVKKGNEDALRSRVMESYPKKTGIEPEVYASNPSDGAKATVLE
jgi:galactokinase